MLGFRCGLWVVPFGRYWVLDFGFWMVFLFFFLFSLSVT